MIKKATLNLLESGIVEVKFEGGHFNKRELLRLIRALKLEHRLSIRKYRKNLMLSKTKELENGKRKPEARRPSNTNSITGTDIKPNEVSGNTESRVVSKVEVG